jgi:hypothetical protein
MFPFTQWLSHITEILCQITQAHSVEWPIPAFNLCTQGERVVGSEDYAKNKNCGV